MLRFGVHLWAPGGTYKVRASPGAFGAGFGFAKLISSSGVHYELHNGIEIDGQSGMNHEADLLLSPLLRARRHRLHREHLSVSETFYGPQNANSMAHRAG